MWDEWAASGQPRTAEFLRRRRSFASGLQ